MAFKTFRWLYNPPPTLAPAPPPVAPPLSPAARDSNAAKLIARLDDLNITARYLEKAIVERTGKLGIKLNLKSDPELAIALERIYGSTPEAISVGMYDFLLDAEAGIQRAEIAVEEVDAEVHVDPVQKADLSRINAYFEDALVEEATVDSALPLLLRPLKGDRIIFDNLKEALSEYPILQGTQSGNSSTQELSPLEIPQDPETGQPLAYVTPDHPETVEAPNTGSDSLNTKIVTSIARQLSQTQSETDSQTRGDMNPDTTANLHERFDAWESYYNGTMGLVSKIDEAYSDLAQYADTYLYRPLAELEAILKMLAALKLFFHRPKLKDIRATMAAFIMPRLVSEVAKYMMQLDQNVETITRPVTSMVASLGRLFGEISNIGTDIAYLAAGGGFTGMVRSAISGQNRMPTKKRIKALDTIPKGLAKLGATLAWGMREMMAAQTYVETTLFKCLDSKLAGDGNSLEIMQALSSVDALTTITKGFLDTGIKGLGLSNVGPGPIANAQFQVDRFLSQNVPALPQISPPPPQAQAVFTAAQTRQGN